MELYYTETGLLAVLQMWGMLL